MGTRMLQRRGTAAQWTAANPVLGLGEIGYVTDTKIFKIGDGVTAWASLPQGAETAGAVATHVAQVDPHTQYLMKTNKAADSDLLDGLDSTQFLRSTAQATDSAKLGGVLPAGYQLMTLLDAKGDIYAASADNTAGRLAVGADGTFLSADSSQALGLRWLAAAKSADVQVFDASGTWTKPANAKLVLTILFGAGGGGYFGLASTATTAQGTGGGGGGATALGYFNPTDLSATETVTVGAGGAAGIVGTSAPTNGGASCFGGSSQTAAKVSSGGGEAGAGGASSTQLATNRAPGVGGSNVFTIPSSIPMTYLNNSGGSTPAYPSLPGFGGGSLASASHFAGETRGACAFDGGGAGGHLSIAGGSSLLGSGGGGGGAINGTVATAGGKRASLVPGGGGAINGGVGTDYQGGGGGSYNGAGAGGNGGNGGMGGGGGGGGNGSTVGGNGGAGGGGRVIVITFF